MAGEREDACTKASMFANGAMKARQSGMLLSEAMENSMDDKAVRHIIAEAYKFPLAESKEEKEKSINEFQNHIYLDCYKAFGG